MTRAVAASAMNQLERAARRAWLENATRVHYGKCGSCQRTNDEHGQHLLVARQPRHTTFECLECWDAGQ